MIREQENKRGPAVIQYTKVQLTRLAIVIFYMFGVFTGMKSGDLGEPTVVGHSSKFKWDPCLDAID